MNNLNQSSVNAADKLSKQLQKFDQAFSALQRVQNSFLLSNAVQNLQQQTISQDRINSIFSATQKLQTSLQAADFSNRISFPSNLFENKLQKIYSVTDEFSLISTRLGRPLESVSAKLDLPNIAFQKIDTDFFQRASQTFDLYQQQLPNKSFVSYKSSIYTLGTQLGKLDSAMQIDTFEDQTISLSDKDELISYLEQHQDVLLDLYAYFEEDLCGKASLAVPIDADIKANESSENISVSSILKIIVDLISLCAALYTLFPDTAEYLMFKAKLIEFVIQTIMLYSYLLPF